MPCVLFCAFDGLWIGAGMIVILCGASECFALASCKICLPFGLVTI